MVLRNMRGLLFPFLVSGFPRTFIYSVAYQFTLLFYILIVRKWRALKIQSKSRHKCIIIIIMEQKKIDFFLSQNATKFPSEKLFLIKEALGNLDYSIQSLELKDPTNLLLFSILLGCLGVDRFMLGQTGLGVLKLLTCGGCYIWWIIDMVNVQKMTREYNYQQLVNILTINGVSLY